MIQASQNGKEIPMTSNNVPNAIAHVAVCTANHPVSAMKMTSAIEKLAPVIPKAFVDVIVALRPRSLPMIPSRIIRRQQTANPITVAQKIELIVSASAKIPPTISIGIHIIVPTQMNAMLPHDRFSDSVI